LLTAYVIDDNCCDYTRTIEN